MSGKPSRKYGSTENHKVMAILVLATIRDPAIHGMWLPISQFTEHLHRRALMVMTFNFETCSVVRHLDKLYPHKS
jgi:hypothetical protein